MNNRLRLLLAMIAFFISNLVFSQISLPLNRIVTENFNSIGSSATATLPTDWRIAPAGTTGPWSAGLTSTTVAANSGLPATGGRYNWATAANTDRSIGFLTSGSYPAPNVIMAYFRNTTGAAVNSVTVSFAVERYVVNTGTFSLTFSSSTDGTTWTSQTDGDIAAGVFATGANEGTFTAPQTVNKTATIPITLANNADVYFRWTFTTTNIASQGLGLDDVSVFAGNATPFVTATLKDILQVDNGIQNQFDTGDVIRYQTVIKNVGTSDATGVQINLPSPPTNTTMVGGSIKTSTVAVDDSYNVSFNTAFAGSSVLTNDVGIPAPTAVITYGATNNVTITPGVATTSDAGATVTMQANGMFTYTPISGFSGVDRFKYITGNGNLPNNDATVTITVAADISFTTTNVDPLCNGGSNGSITFNATGGVAPLQYSISGSAGTYQSSNVFTGLAANTYNLAVKDANGVIKTSTTTINNPAAIVVSGTTPVNIVYNTAMLTVTYSKTGGSGSPANPWSATNLPSGVSLNPATGDVSGTPTVTGSFNATITYTDANGCTGSLPIIVNAGPNLQPDTYTTVVGNTQLVADAHSAPATPFTASATNILSNDGSNSTITVTAVTNAATTAGGSITIDAAGKFTYTPKNNFTGNDSYTYTGTSNGVSATATINFTVANMVWYVNNTYGGANGVANGSSNRPYTDVASAEAASSASQTIYVHTGSGNTTGAVVLKAGQVLRGEGNALTIGALSIPAGTKPTLTGTITLANSVTADGFDMNTGANTAISSSGATAVAVSIGNVTTSGAVNSVTLTNTTGTITIAGGTQTASTGATFSISGGSVNMTYSGNVTQTANAAILSVAGGHTGQLVFNSGILNGTNGSGLQFDNADGSYLFNGTLTLNGGDAAIDILNGSAGNFSFVPLSGQTASITNPTGIALNVFSSAANVIYSGSITKTNNATTGIAIRNNTGGTIDINGTGAGIVKTLSTQTANAVDITGNSGGTTVNISGNNLSITTTSGVGFNATTTSPGVTNISVTGTGNAITSPSGTALNVVNTAISSSGLTFQSISSAGSAAPTGIILNNTGLSAANGGLTVTGNATAGSGGTIANKTGTDNVYTTGCGIYLDNTKNPSFSRMQLNDFQNHGIYGANVSGFTFNNSVISGVSGTNGGGGFNESSIAFRGLTGSCTVSGSNISGGYSNNFYITNSSGVLNRLTFTSTTIGANSTLGGNDGISVEGLGTATVNVTIQTCTFTSAKGDLLQMIADGSGGGDLVVNGSNFSNNHPSIATGGGGVTINGGAAGNFTVNMDGNTFRDAVGHALLFVKTVGTGNMTVTVNNNQVGVAGTANSGSLEGTGMKFQHAGSGSTVQNTATSRFTLNITNNQIRQYNNEGILIQGGAGIAYSGNIIATISGNTLANPGSNAAITNVFQGLVLNNGVTPGDNFLTCFNVGANTINGSGRNGGFDFRVRARQSTTVRLPGYAGGNMNTAAVTAFLQGKIGGAPTGSSLADATSGGFVGTACQ